MKRCSGILLHVTSLPSSYGIGDLGPEAYRFVDFLVEAKQSIWQILPLNPINPIYGNSPYSSSSAFAGNVLLISPKLMIEEGYITRGEVKQVPRFSRQRVNYSRVLSYKKKLFDRAYESFKRGKDTSCEYEKFCKENSKWLEDFAFFVAAKGYFDEKPWNEWPLGIRDRNWNSLQNLRYKLKDKIDKEKFLQYLFFKQWFSLKKYCNQKNIQLIGDVPIYLNYDSVDVWSNPEFFKLNEEKKPLFISGVPPDYFSKTGQLWGNPIYRWDLLMKTGYKWWIRRMEHNFRLFNQVRIDHFRGFIGFWEVPAGETTAINGQWVKAPAEDFFNTLLKRFSYLPIIAEDLGVITPDVREVMNRYGFPGMRILLFAFGEDTSRHPYIPHNYVRNCVVYTGTHDNNTARGWFEREAGSEEKKRLFLYLGREITPNQVSQELIRLAHMSIADTVIVPMQDVLGLGEETRMNRPAIPKGNWEWRLLSEWLTSTLAEDLARMTEIYGRF